MFGYIAEQPYDSIPNFTAADTLRLTGVGRNEFIDIMNKCRSKVVSSIISWPLHNITCSCNLVKHTILDILTKNNKNQSQSVDPNYN